MSFKDRLAFFQNAISQQNANGSSHMNSSRLNDEIKENQKTKYGQNQQTSFKKPEKQINQTKESSVTCESKKDAQKSNSISDGGFAEKIAFFKNQVNVQSTQNKNVQNKELNVHHAHQKINQNKEVEAKVKSEESKKEVSKTNSPTSSKFADKMSFFNNQVNTKNTHEKATLNKESHRHHTHQKINHNKDEDVKVMKEESKKEISNSNSQVDGGFADKMAFFNNQVSNHNEQEKQKSSHTRANFAERVAMFNKLAVPLGKPAERKSKSSKFDNQSEMINQKEPSTLSEMLEIEKDNNDIIKVRNDSNEDSNCQELVVRRQHKCRSQRRRPEHIPGL